MCVLILLVKLNKIPRAANRPTDGRELGLRTVSRTYECCAKAGIIWFKVLIAGCTKRPTAASLLLQLRSLSSPTLIAPPTASDETSISFELGGGYMSCFLAQRNGCRNKSKHACDCPVLDRLNKFDAPPAPLLRWFRNISAPGTSSSEIVAGAAVLFWLSGQKRCRKQTPEQPEAMLKALVEFVTPMESGWRRNNGWSLKNQHRRGAALQLWSPFLLLFIWANLITVIAFLTQPH